MPTKNVILIEDDQKLNHQFKVMLELEDFRVSTFQTAEDYLLSSDTDPNKPYLYLIDLNLPGLSGSELVKVIRYKDKLSPIFIITGDSPDRSLERCLSAGADDFLMKPYNPEHLLLKLRNAQLKLGVLLGSMIDFGVKLVPEARLVSRDGKKLKLTGREFAIMSSLLNSPGEIQSRDYLVKELGDADVTIRTIDVHVSSLRKKIIALNLNIETCRGKGYRVQGAVKAEAI